jgi:hypothetical protein
MEFLAHRTTRAKSKLPISPELTSSTRHQVTRGRIPSASSTPSVWIGCHCLCQCRLVGLPANTGGASWELQFFGLDEALAQSGSRHRHVTASRNLCSDSNSRCIPLKGKNGLRPPSARQLHRLGSEQGKVASWALLLARQRIIIGRYSDEGSFRVLSCAMQVPWPCDPDLPRPHAVRRNHHPPQGHTDTLKSHANRQGTSRRELCSAM